MWVRTINPSSDIHEVTRESKELSRAAISVRHPLALLEASEPPPGQTRDVFSDLRAPPSWTCLVHLQRKATRGRPHQIHKRSSTLSLSLIAELFIYHPIKTDPRPCGETMAEVSVVDGSGVKAQRDTSSSHLCKENAKDCVTCLDKGHLETPLGTRPGVDVHQLASDDKSPTCPGLTQPKQAIWEGCVKSPTWGSVPFLKQCKRAWSDLTLQAPAIETDSCSTLKSQITD